MFTARSSLLFLLFLPCLLLGVVRSLEKGVSSSPATVVRPVFNGTAYKAVCVTSDFSLVPVCGLSGEFAKDMGSKLDTRYLASKLLSESTVSELAAQCDPGDAGQKCLEAWDQLRVNEIKFGWRDAIFRRKLCSLRPCMAAMLHAKTPAACNNTARFLNFRAFSLLCTLADKFGVDDDSFNCLDAAVELLQFSAADVVRGKSSMREVCDCIKNYAKPCPDSCKPMIKKFVCLSTRCSIDSASYFDKFPEWSWYFRNEDELRRRYKVDGCDEEVIETRPFVVAVVNFYGLQNAIIAICISIVIASVLATGFFICYRRSVGSRVTSRNRCEYTEMKEDL